MTRLEHLTPAAVDAEIVYLSELIEQRTDEFREANQRAAESEARYKYRYATTLLAVIGEFHGTRSTVDERNAHVEQRTADEHSAYLISKAAAQSSKEALNSVRTQLDATRTLAANYRHMGGHQ